MTARVLVTGAGGFIGHHLVTALRASGHWVRGVDVKFPDFASSDANEFLICDLRSLEACEESVFGIDAIYHLAADMGGIGYITSHHAEIARNNTLIDLHMLQAAADARVSRLLYTSSACVYPSYRQRDADVAPLREEDAYPADPDEAYGWEKLYAERLCRHFQADFGLNTRIVRLHNVYGPLGTYEGGREKAPAAICRKVALALDGDQIEVWGDGQQTRSFLYVADCVDGLQRVMRSSYAQPINLGTDRLVTINNLVDIVARIAGKSLRKRHDLSGPQGVRGRNSDNRRLREVLRWEPSTRLETGLACTYEWIHAQVESSQSLPALTESTAS